MTPQPLTPAEVAAVDEMCEAATPGPWTFNAPGPPSGCVDIFHPDDGRDDCRVAEWVQEMDGDRNATFIAAARTLVPRLLATLRQVSEERDVAKTEAVEAAATMSLLEAATEIVRQQAAEVHRLRAALEIDEPAEEPGTRIIVGCDYRCHICGGAIPAESEAAVFESPGAIMHWGPCPKPDLWGVEYKFDDLTDWIRRRSGDGAWPYEDARNIGRDVAAEHGVVRVRLVRVPRSTP